MNEKNYKAIAEIMKEHCLGWSEEEIQERTNDMRDLANKLADYFEKELTHTHYRKLYDRKIKVKCNTCGAVYTKWANRVLYNTVDGSECKCKPNFTVIEVINFDRKQFLKDCGVEQ